MRGAFIRLEGASIRSKELHSGRTVKDRWISALERRECAGWEMFFFPNWVRCAYVFLNQGQKKTKKIVWAGCSHIKDLCGCFDCLQVLCGQDAAKLHFEGPHL